MTKLEFTNKTYFRYIYKKYIKLEIYKEKILDNKRIEKIKKKDYNFYDL